MTYPEHEKLATIKDQSQAIGSFLEWLGEQGITLCILHDKDEEYHPCYKPINKLLAEYFEIDQDRLEEEKRAMLDEIRKAHDRYAITR